MRKRHEVRKGRAIRTGLLGVLVMSVLLAAGMPALAADGESPPAPTTPAPTAPQPAQQTGAPGGPQEGIKVHGRWTIEVRNPDGTLVSRHEFENALISPPYALSEVFGRKHSVGLWRLELSTMDTRTRPCSQSATLNFGCVIAEANDPAQAAPNLFKTLVVDVPVSGVNANKLVLSGNARALVTGVINRVDTNLSFCLPSVAPASCTSFSSSYLPTRAVIPDVNISGGQLIEVTVVISFS